MLVLQPFVQPDLGIVMFKPGTTLLSEVTKMSKGNRLVLMPLPDELVNTPSGKLSISLTQKSDKSLVLDWRLLPFFQMDEVRARLGDGFRFWVERIPHCQMSDEGYCDKNLTVCSYEQDGLVRKCWHHDNLGISDQGAAIAKRNLMLWAVESITHKLGLPSGHQLTLQELAWWCVINDIYRRLPSSIVDELMGKKDLSKSIGMGAKMDTDARYQPSNEALLDKYAGPITKLTIDDEPPAMYMARPKERTWKSRKYLKFVRTLPCRVCAKTAGVAHHLIGHGEGKMGGKAHDMFIIPLCNEHHQELHRNVLAWESKHGSQLWHLKETINKALNVGAID